MAYIDKIANLITEDPDIFTEASEYKFGYWVTNKEHKIGTILYPKKKNEFEGYRRYVEVIFEKVRRDEYPDLPSRLNSSYVSVGLPGARNWLDKLAGKYIYKVALHGNMALLDGNGLQRMHDIITRAFKHSDRKQWDYNDKIELRNSLISMANEYWSGKLTNGPFTAELLVDGSIEISHLVYKR